MTAHPELFVTQIFLPCIFMANERVEILRAIILVAREEAGEETDPSYQKLSTGDPRRNALSKGGLLLGKRAQPRSY
jgi:hypothetical protein